MKNEEEFNKILRKVYFLVNEDDYKKLKIIIESTILKLTDQKLGEFHFEINLRDREKDKDDVFEISKKYLKLGSYGIE